MRKGLLFLLIFLLGYFGFVNLKENSVSACDQNGDVKCGYWVYDCSDPLDPSTCGSTCKAYDDAAGQACWEEDGVCKTYACSECLVGSCGQPHTANPTTPPRDPTNTPTPTPRNPTPTRGGNPPTNTPTPTSPPPTPTRPPGDDCNGVCAYSSDPLVADNPNCRVNESGYCEYGKTCYFCSGTSPKPRPVARIEAFNPNNINDLSDPDILDIKFYFSGEGRDDVDRWTISVGPNPDSLKAADGCRDKSNIDNICISTWSYGSPSPNDDIGARQEPLFANPWVFEGGQICYNATIWTYVNGSYQIPYPGYSLIDCRTYYPPNGFLEGVDPNSCTAVGWACSPDPTRSSESLEVIIREVGSNRELGRGTANLPRGGDDATTIANLCGGNSNRRFEISLDPNNYQTTSIQAYVVDTKNGDNVSEYILKAPAGVYDPPLTYRCLPATPTPTSSPPSPPENLRFNCGWDQGNTATITWDLVDGATGYAVRVDNKNNGWTGDCNNLNPGDYCAIVSSNSFSFNFVPDEPYEVWVHAIGPGGWSASTRVEPNPFICLSCKGGYQVSCSADATRARISWNSDPQASGGYVLSVDNESDLWFTPNSDRVIQTDRNEYTLNVTPDVSYKYDVQGKLRGEQPPFQGQRCPFSSFKCSLVITLTPTPTPTLTPTPPNNQNQAIVIDNLRVRVDKGTPACTNDTRPTWLWDFSDPSPTFFYRRFFEIERNYGLTGIAWRPQFTPDDEITGVVRVGARVRGIKFIPFFGPRIVGPWYPSANSYGAYVNIDTVGPAAPDKPTARVIVRNGVNFLSFSWRASRDQGCAAEAGLASYYWLQGWWGQPDQDDWNINSGLWKPNNIRFPAYEVDCTGRAGETFTLSVRQAKDKLENTSRDLGQSGNTVSIACPDLGFPPFTPTPTPTPTVGGGTLTPPATPPSTPTATPEATPTPTPKPWIKVKNSSFYEIQQTSNLFSYYIPDNPDPISPNDPDDDASVLANFFADPLEKLGVVSIENIAGVPPNINVSSSVSQGGYIDGYGEPKSDKLRGVAKFKGYTQTFRETRTISSISAIDGADMVYIYSGNLSLSNDDLPAADFVLIVDGDLDIGDGNDKEEKFNSAERNIVIFANKITIKGDIAEIYGVLIAERITVENTDPNDDYGLKVKGNLVAFNSFSMERERGSNNNAPSLFIVRDLRPYLYNLEKLSYKYVLRPGRK